MRNLLSLFCICTLALTLSVVAQGNSREQAVQKMASAMAANGANGANGANETITFNILMTRIKGVEKAVGEKLEYRLALQIALCAEMAAHPNDPGTFGDGIDFSRIEAKTAIQTCGMAYNLGGDKIGLVLASLSRAFNKAEKYDSSFDFTNQAVAVDYPYGYVLVGQHYFYGDSIKKDLAEQFRWYEKAAEKGVSSAMRSMASDYTKGISTAVNHNQAYYWSLQAIEKNDGKALYQLGQLLEGKVTASNEPRKLLVLAKQAYEVAAKNGVSAAKDIDKINTKLYPNRFSAKTTQASEFIKRSGPIMANGHDVSRQEDSNWYLVQKKQSDQHGYSFAYARTTHDNNTLTIWYQHAANINDSGWYTTFRSYVNLKDLKSMSVTSVISGKTEHLGLNLSDVKRVTEMFVSIKSGRLTFRDVLLLSRGELVKMQYSNTDRPGTSTYTMRLNHADTYKGSHKSQSAKTVISQLIKAARKLNKSCCAAPNIEPLSDRYANLYKVCKKKLTIV